MKSKITLKKIAEELGVSVSTVSKALHNHKDISKDNRERIQAFAKFHNYKPNSLAVSLKTNTSRKIGLIIPEIVHYFFAEIIAGVEEVARDKGYSVIIGVSNESLNREVMNMQMLSDSGVDGFLISLSKETFRKSEFFHLQDYINQGIPLVMFDRVIDTVECNKVIIDDEAAGRKGAETLISNGAKNILIISTENYLKIGRMRTKGAIEAIEYAGLTLDEEMVLELDYMEGIVDTTFLETAIENHFKKHPEIDGVFAVNEVCAITAINVARKMGLHVPNDIMVTGFSNGILSRVSRPELTTIDQHGKLIGRKAASVLLEQLEADDENYNFKSHVIETTLIERNSTLKKVGEKVTKG